MADPEIIAAILTSGMVLTQPDIAPRPEYSLNDEQIQKAFRQAATHAVGLYRDVPDALREDEKTGP
jgi:hypothetical protein